MARQRDREAVDSHDPANQGNKQIFLRSRIRATLGGRLKAGHGEI